MSTSEAWFARMRLSDATYGVAEFLSLGAFSLGLWGTTGDPVFAFPAGMCVYLVVIMLVEAGAYRYDVATDTVVRRG